MYTHFSMPGIAHFLLTCSYFTAKRLCWVNLIFQNIFIVY